MKALITKKGEKTVRFIGRLFRRLISLVLLIACIFGILYLVPLTERVDTNGLEADASWMSRLPDTVRLNEITIPGTHQDRKSVV